MKLHIVVLAAGKGTRMRSDRPKVLHELAGRSMLHWVLDAALGLSPESIRVVIGHEAAAVRAASGSYPVEWVEQDQQLGTGHAMQCALQKVGVLGHEDLVLTLFGDVPLTSVALLRQLVEEAEQQDLTLLSAIWGDPTGYGRIVRDEMGNVAAIREHKDATPGELAIREINTGIMAIRGDRLQGWLDELKADNAQGELYLTDIVGLAHAEGARIAAVSTDDEAGVTGVNDRWALAQLERVVQQRQAKALALQGVTLLDPDRLDIRGNLTVGRDVVIEANVLFEGTVVLGDRVHIESNCVIRDSAIGDDCRIRAFSHVDGARLATNIEAGPYVRLRPGTEMAAGSKAGNFVEIKASRIGTGSKINHLTYIGDTEMGRDCNIGAGSITCNYDGANKHRTVIGNRVFIGSSTQLVAPVTVGDDATTAAGSTITRDVLAGHLAIARARQTQLSDWQRPTKKPKE